MKGKSKNPSQNMMNVPYDPTWPFIFKEISEILQKSLPNLILSVEHVGSTAVPGLISKPRLDIDIVVESLENLSLITDKLKKLGYYPQGDLGRSGREAFGRLDDLVPYDGKGRVWMKHNLYVCPQDSQVLREHIKFRDILRNNSEIATKYARLKENLAEKYQFDQISYVQGKTGFIEKILNEVQIYNFHLTMRKITALIMLSLDGVMQAPGAPEEDTSGDFKYGGWTAPYADESFGDIIQAELSLPFDLLLGRKTYQIFASYWPHQTGIIADPFNQATKYVVSDKGVDLTWKESILISGDVANEVKSLKQQDGPTLQVWGSSNFLQTLLKNDLVDELRLRIYPVTIGLGKRLFAEGTIPAAFELLDSQALPSGVILANYKRSGPLKTGSLL